MTEDPWKYVRVDPVEAARNPYLHPRTPPPPPDIIPSALDGDYILMPETRTYALGVQALRESYDCGECPAQPTFVFAGNSIVRPLTFKENIEARVTKYENNQSREERLRLLYKWLDSVTGVVYKKNKSTFKIVPLCEQLVTIASDFAQTHISIDYNTVLGIELDKSKGKYNTVLTKDEVLVHPGWKAAVENDTALLRAYRDIVFAEKADATKLMAFRVIDNLDVDQLRALYVNNLYDSSNANGSNDLVINGYFLRVVHR